MNTFGFLNSSSGKFYAVCYGLSRDNSGFENQRPRAQYLEYSSRSYGCLLYTSPSPRDRTRSRMPSSA